MILKHVKQTILRHHLFDHGQHMLVCVSGGADSMALLFVLHDLAPELELQLTVAHLNHSIRGRAADEDARFVEATARKLGIDFITENKDVPALARRRGLSLEMAGREARYAFFARAARAKLCDVAATAHTADDQAETILLKLSRGSGPQGLRGITYISHWKNLKIVRPLRDMDRKSIIRFLEGRRLKWREDASNENTAFLRNRVRHDILPFLESKLNPRLRRSLMRLGNIMEEENEWLEALTTQILSECRIAGETQQKTGRNQTQSGTSLLCKPLARCPLAARRRVLRQWLVSCGMPHEQLDFEATDQINGLLSSARSGRAVTLADGWIVRRQYDRLIAKKGYTDLPSAFCVRLNIPGETLLPEQGFRIVTLLKPGLFREQPRGIGVFPARASLSTTTWRRRRISARSWQAGDRIAPLGLKGSKKIQDIFVDMKVPKERRHQMPMFVCGEEIIWVPGYRIARGWEIKEPSARALQLVIDLI